MYLVDLYIDDKQTKTKFYEKFQIKLKSFILADVQSKRDIKKLFYVEEFACHMEKHKMKKNISIDCSKVIIFSDFQVLQSLISFVMNKVNFFLSHIPESIKKFI